MSSTALRAPTRARTPFARYRHALWLLTTRDLKVRYSTSALGYLWSIIDPLIMSAIYLFVFTVVFKRSVGEDPYIIFLLTGLLPWTWFTGAVSDCTRAFTREAKLIRSTTIPRTIWVARLVLSKGIEFCLSLPVLVIFGVCAVVFFGSPLALQPTAPLFLLAMVLQTVLTLGIGLIIAPLVVFFRDLERAVKLILRFAFYASPIVYGLPDLQHNGLELLGSFNPMAGILSLYRSAFFPDQLDWFAVGMSALLSVALLGIGLLVFRRTIRAVLKEI